MVAIVAAAVLSAGIGVAAGVTLFGLTALQTGFVLAGANIVFSFITRSRASSQYLPSFSVEVRDRVQTAKNTSQERLLIIGEVKVGGPLMLFSSSGTDNEFLHIVEVHADHPCDGITEWFLNNEAAGTLDGSGNVTAGRFEDHVRLVAHLGAFDQAAPANLVSEVAEWTSAHKAGGCTLTEARLKQSQNVWPNGFTGIAAVVRGMYLYDPRDTAATITTSSAASPAVFTTSAAHGRGVGDYIWIKGHSGAVRTGTAPAPVDKEYQVKTVPTTTTLTVIDEDGVAVDLATGGTGGTLTKMVWSDNWALGVRRFLCHNEGFKADNDEIDDTLITAAANTSDEQVSLTTEPRTFTVDTATEKLTLASKTTWKTGDAVTLTTTVTLPAPLALATTYYGIRVDQSTVKLATSLVNARAGTAINITDTGTGTHTITRNSQLRYTCNGTILAGKDPVEILDDLMTAAAGVVVWDEGKFKVFAGAATASTGTTDETDNREKGILIDPLQPLPASFNAARGTFVDRDQFWAEVPAAPYTNATYEAEDNNQRIYGNFKYPYTTDRDLCQRLQKIAVERTRQGATIHFPAKPRKYKTAVWDVETLTLDHAGYVAKQFRAMKVVEHPDGAIDIVWREEADAVWDWNLGDETSIDLAPNSNLPDAFTVAKPTGLTLTSGTAQLDTRLDGTIFSRLKVSWTAPADEFVTSGGHIEVAYRKSAGIWIFSQPLPGDVTETFILDVKDGVAYDVALRAVNNLGVRSDTNNDPATWQALVTSHTVVGKTVDPADVASLIVQQNGELVTFKWPAISDLDRDGYELRYMATPFVWASAILISEETKGTLVTNRAVPPGAWVIGIKAIDTSGNYSANAVTASITISNFNDIVASRIEHPRWPGTLTGFVRHDVSGTLIPDSNTLAKDMTDAQLWDQMVYDPVATPTYEAKEIDLGFDADGVRVFAELDAVIGPGESGVADPQLSIDYRDEGDAYDGFEDWPTAADADFRRLKARAKITTATGVAALKEFKPIADVAERTEKGTATIAIGGTTITFAQRFHSTPNIQVTPSASAFRGVVKDNESATAFDAIVFDSAGVDVGGPVDWQAIGA